MQNQHLENIWFKSVIDNAAYIEATEPSFFKNLDYQEAFKVVKSFWKKYQQIPSKNQVREAAKILKIDDVLTDSLLESMWSITLLDYDSDWLRQNTESWIEWKVLERSAIDSINYIKGTPVSPDNIKDVINTYKSIVVDRNKVDFSFDLGLNFKDTESHRQYATNTFSSGYDYIDHCFGGGFSSKSLYILLGQPKIGKCFLGVTKVRNKCTGEIRDLHIKDFYETLSKTSI